VCCLKNGSTTQDLGQDGFDRGRPDEWPGVGVVERDVGVDRGHEVRHVPEDAPPDALGYCFDSVTLHEANDTPDVPRCREKRRDDQWIVATQPRAVRPAVGVAATLGGTVPADAEQPRGALGWRRTSSGTTAG